LKLFEDEDQTQRSLFGNPWFYGFIIALGILFLISAVMSPRIKDPWFWQAEDRSRAASQPDRQRLIRQLPKHPEDRGIGSSDAPITITEFSNLACEACGQYVRQYMSVILREFVQTGRVYYRVRHLPLPERQPGSVLVSVAAECAGNQGKFWSFRRAITESNSPLSKKQLIAMGSELSMKDPSAYQKCVQNRDTIDRVRSDRAEAQSRPVRKIPSLYVGETYYDSFQSVEELRQVIRRELSR
jgi:protein-disulfide isomerase